MAESFLQFPVDRAYPSKGWEYHMLNPGSCTTSYMSLYTPLPFSGTLSRFRVVVRGKWLQAQNEVITARVTKNRVQIEESEVFFIDERLDHKVKTRHQTTYPDIKFEEGDTIGVFMYFSSNKLNNFYTSAIVNFVDV